MQDILAGIRAFQRDVYPQSRELFQRLASGQSPEAMIIACSDSRVDPFMITQARPGQLFVLRNAGNIVPRYGEYVGGVTATIEFAVVGLKVPNIIVCGHTGCGAMSGLLDPQQLREMPRVAEWLHFAAPVREALVQGDRLNAPDALQWAVETNVVLQLEQLRTHPSVDEKLRDDAIKLHGWVYDIASGQVKSFDEREHRFVPLV